MSNSKPMVFLSSAAFWGIVIVLFGLSIILREVFHIHFPIFKIVIGGLLIYWGAKMIAGGLSRSSPSGNEAVFGNSDMADDGIRKEYNIVFGNANIDLFKMEFKESRKIEVNVVFGRGILVLNDSIPVMVEMNSVFGSSEAPDRSSTALGKTTYTTSAYKAGEPHVFIETNVVFGKLEIQTKRW